MLTRLLPIVAILAGALYPQTTTLANVESALEKLKASGLKAAGEAPKAAPTEPIDPRVAFPGSGMEKSGLPDAAADSWGDSSRPAPKPTAPNRTDMPWFQTLVDAAPVGSVLKVPPGDYAGPVLVDKTL
ncbi:MAG TPA: hypothetical protein PLC58_05985, partial [Denitromonas sp.]|nr:hypothetical protein [Denitromonas sp.]